MRNKPKITVLGENEGSANVSFHSKSKRIARRKLREATFPRPIPTNPEYPEQLEQTRSEIFNNTLIKTNHLIPDEILQNIKRMCKNKNIVLVGNSSSIMNYKWGSFIDQHDVVIRMNNGFNSSDKVAFLGRKTDIISCSFPSYRSFKQCSNFFSKVPYLLWLNHRLKERYIPTQKEYKNDFFYNCRDLVCYTPLKDFFEPQRPSTGIITTNWLVKNLEYKSLTLVGFDFMKTKSWYNSPNYVSPHHTNTEERFLRKLEEENKIKIIDMDTEKKQLLKTENIPKIKTAKGIMYANDTSTYHYGCDLTNEVLKKLISRHGRIVQTMGVVGMQPKLGIAPNVGTVIINGEGSFHHNRKHGASIYQLAKMAKAEGKKVCLINSVFDGMSVDMSVFDYFCARESLSSLGKFDFVHDACFYEQIDTSKNTEEYILFTDSVMAGVTGQLTKYIPHLKNNNYPVKFLPFRQGQKYPKKEELFEIFRKAKAVVSGRYHGVVFALMFNKPIFGIASNTHKILGLMKDYNLEKYHYKSADDIFRGEIQKFNKMLKEYPKYEIDTIGIKNRLEQMVARCFE